MCIRDSPNLVRRCLTEGTHADEDEIDSAVAVFRRHYAVVNGARTRIYPGVGELLERLRGHGLPLAVVTNKAEAFTLPLLERMAIAHYFDAVVSGDTLPEKKPHPQPLLLAAGRLGRRPGACAYVGDAERDMLAARAAGMHGVLATFGYLDPATTWNDWPCVATIARLGELLPWLRLNGLVASVPLPAGAVFAAP